MKNLSTVLVCLLSVSALNAFAVDDRGNTATQGAYNLAAGRAVYDPNTSGM